MRAPHELGSCFAPPSAHARRLVAAALPLLHGHIDIGTKEELIASNRTEAEICEMIGADSLVYLGMPGLVKAVDHAIDNFCLACFDGEYPVSVPIQLEMDKLSLEPKVRAEPAGRPGA
jgi:glutamine phosphoribosylpyrophosphate amidotransferase